MIDAARRRFRAERSERGHRPRAGRMQGRGVRGQRYDWRRRALGRADAAGLRSRHLFGRPSIRGSRRRSGGRCRWPRTGSSGSSRPAMLGHPFDDGERGRRGAIGGRDRGAARPRRPTRTAARRRGSCERLAAARACRARAVRRSRASARARAFRAPGAALGQGVGDERISRSERTRAHVRRHRRARHAAARSRADGRRRPDARRDVPRRRLADSARRRAARSPTRWRRHLRSLGGEIVTDVARDDIDDAAARARSCCAICRRGRCCGSRATVSRRAYRRLLERIATAWACSKSTGRSSAPIPWTAEACRRAGTRASRGQRWTRSRRRSRRRGTARIADRPFVLLSQPTLFDPSRAPAGKHVAWGYCHVPGAIDRRHARSRSSGRSSVSRRDSATACWRASVTTPADIEAHNANFVGGDIARRRHRPAAVFHAADLAQLLDAGERALHLFRLDAARCRRPRHVRLSRGQTRTEAALTRCCGGRRRSVARHLACRPPFRGPENAHLRRRVGGLRGDPAVVTPLGLPRLQCGFRVIETALLTGVRQTRCTAPLHFNPTREPNARSPKPEARSPEPETDALPIAHRPSPIAHGPPAAVPSASALRLAIGKLAISD